MALKSITTGKWSTVMRTRKFINLKLSIPYYSRVAESRMWLVANLLEYQTSFVQCVAMLKAWFNNCYHSQA